MASSGPAAEVDRLTKLLEADPWFMAILRTVRDLHLPNWVVGAGVIRNLVWDRFQGMPRTAPHDVDVAYFDPHDVSESRDEAIAAELSQRHPGVPWEVTNQAGVHLWYHKVFGYPVEALDSIEDAVATWPETATAVAVRLRGDDRLDVIAPYGVGDLLGMVLRRNPRRVSYAHFLERLQAKRIADKWPQVRVVYENRSSPRSAR